MMIGVDMIVIDVHVFRIAGVLILVIFVHSKLSTMIDSDGCQR